MEVKMIPGRKGCCSKEAEGGTENVMVDLEQVSHVFTLNLHQQHTFFFFPLSPVDVGIYFTL